LSLKLLNKSHAQAKENKSKAWFSRRSMNEFKPPQYKFIQDPK
jgi:hypothetical protein